MAITSILGGTFTELTVIKGADIDGTTLIVDPDNDRVGIGLLLPKTKLTIEGALTMKEQAAADSDTAAYGQLWIKTASPNELYFTTDAGDDIQLTTGTGPAFVGDITSVVAGTGLSGGGTTGDVTLNVSGLAVAQGGTGATAFSDNAVIISQDSGTDTLAAAVMDASGELLIGGTSGPAVATLTAGSNVTITNGDGTISIASSGGASALNDLSDVSYSSGDLIITSLDKLTTSASAHDAAGVAVVMQAGSTTAGTSNNQAGGALTIAGGQGKGSGAGGDIVFQTANAGGSGSSINSLATALTISDDLSSTFAGIVDITDTTDSSNNSGDTGALRCEGGASIAMKLYVGSDTHLPNNVYIGKSLFHADDTTTRLHFFNTNDTISLEVANLDFLRCVEDGTDSESVFNYSGHANIDFRVSGDAETHLFYIDAGNERISIGDSVDAPAATLEITNHASAGATGVPLLQLNNNDIDKEALDINASNTGSPVASIINGAVNNSPILLVESTAAETNPLIELINSSNNADKPPVLKFAKINGAADDYDIATISFNGENDAGTPEPIEYAKIAVEASDITDSKEAGEITISVMSGGTAGTASMTEAIRIGQEDATGSPAFSILLNASNADLNVQMRSENKNNMFFLDAGLDRVGVGIGVPTSTFHVRGSAARDITNQTTGTLAITESHNVVTCDTSGGNVECDLPAISGITGRIYTFIKIHASNSMIIDPNGSELIFISAAPSGGAAVTRGDNGSVLTLICTSVGWNVLSDFVPA